MEHLNSYNTASFATLPQEAQAMSDFTKPSPRSRSSSLAEPAGESVLRHQQLALVDQKSDTMDLSAWSSSMGLAYNQTSPSTSATALSSSKSSANQSSSALSDKPSGSALIVNRNIRAAWNESSVASTLDSDRSTGYSSLSSSSSSLSNLFDDSEGGKALLVASAAANKQEPSGFSGSMIDAFSRRASTSQLSIYSGWDLPDSTTFHRQNKDHLCERLTFTGPTSDASHKSSNSTSIDMSFGSSFERRLVGAQRDRDRDMSITASLCLPIPHDEISHMTSKDRGSHQTSFHLPPQLSNANPQSQQQQLSSYGSRRSNSRVLPNLIQPPVAFNARNAGIDEERFENELSQRRSSMQHGGFVPGYDIWSSQAEKEVAGTVGADGGDHGTDGSTLNMHNQRRKSESVLHNLKTVELLRLMPSSICPPSSGANASSMTPSLSIVSFSSTGSTNPLESGAGDRAGSTGFFAEGYRLREGHRLSVRSGSFSSDHRHPLSPIEQDFGSPGNDFRTFGDAPFSATLQSSVQKPFESAQSILEPMLADPHGASGTDASAQEMCGLCCVQRAIVPMGGCGHKVCSVCHRHEKHRSMRLFQNATPPCPFCTHSMTPAPSNGNFSMRQPSGIGSLRQQRHLSLPQISQQQLLQHTSYANQQQQRHDHQQKHTQAYQGRGSYGCKGSNIEEFMESAGYNHEHHSSSHYGLMAPQTYGTHMRTPSTQQQQQQQKLDSGNYTDHLQLPNSHQKPPPGFYNMQTTSGVRPNAQTYSQPYHYQQQQGFQQMQELNQHAASFQPSAGGGIGRRCQENGANFTPLSCPTIMSPQGSAWRDGGADYFGSAQNDYSYSNGHLSAHVQQSHYQARQQQRRGSQHHNLQTTNGAVGHQAQHPQNMYYGGNTNGYGHTQEHAAHSFNNGDNSSYMEMSSTTLSSFSILPNLPPAVPPKSPRTEAIQWAVVRVANIPWDISLQDMLSFFSGFPYPPEHLLPQNVHILMDRATGKTFNSAFIELALTPHQAGMVAQERNLKVLKGRLVTVELSSQDELLRSIFPKWAGQFLQGEPVILGEQPVISQSQASAIISAEDVVDGRTDMAGSIANISMNSIAAGTAKVTPPFVTRDEINTLLLVCRNYKLHFSRKCAGRPFENIISILAKYPWHQPHRVPPLHRDHIFELLKLSIESLKMHLSKEYSTIHPTLLARMIRSAILTPAFTERQKLMVLHTAACACPEDIVGWMVPPVPVGADMEADEAIEVQDTLDNNRFSSEFVNDVEISVMKDEGAHMDLSDNQIEDQIQSLGISEDTVINTETAAATKHGCEVTSTLSIDTSIVQGQGTQQYSRTSEPPTPSPDKFDFDGLKTTAGTSVLWASLSGPPPWMEAKRTTDAVTAERAKATENAAGADPASLVLPMVTSTNEGSRSDAMVAPSYAAAVVQPIPPVAAFPVHQQQNGIAQVSFSNANGTALSRSYSSNNNGRKSNEIHNNDEDSNSGRPLSLSSLSAFTPPNAKTNLQEFQAVLLVPSLSRAKSYSSSVTSSRNSSQASTPTNNSSPLSMSPSSSSSEAVASKTALVSGGEKSKSESILDAIKTITQSTPRLSKLGPQSLGGTSFAAVVASASVQGQGQSVGADRQQ